MGCFNLPLCNHRLAYGAKNNSRLQVAQRCEQWNICKDIFLSFCLVSGLMCSVANRALFSKHSVYVFFIILQTCVEREKREHYWQFIVPKRRNRMVLYVVKMCATASLIFKVSWRGLGSQSSCLTFGSDSNHYGKKNWTTIMIQNQQVHPSNPIAWCTDKHNIPLRDGFRISGVWLQQNQSFQHDAHQQLSVMKTATSCKVEPTSMKYSPSDAQTSGKNCNKTSMNHLCPLVFKFVCCWLWFWWLVILLI